MVVHHPIALVSLIVVAVFFILQLLSRTSLFYALKNFCVSLADKCHAYQFFKVPQYNENMQENQLYRRISTYLGSLASLEDSNFANLFTGTKPQEIALCPESNQTVRDNFLSSRLYWVSKINEENGGKVFVLKIRRSDKRRILRPYLQHIHAVSEEIEQRRKEVKLYVNYGAGGRNSIGRWRSVPFTHPATMETVVLDHDLKNKVKADLELFLKSKQYYQRLGRVWKRSYMLYGSSGTGKSSFVAAMARLLCYDVYDVDLSRVSDDADLKMLLLQTTSKSLIVIEDLDRYLIEKSAAVSLPGILNFMDGIISCCGEERVMVFTMNSKDQIDPTVLRPGRVDVHIHFPLCDFSAFKSLANSHLGVKDHKLFPQVEEIFQTGACLSTAEIGEIMISNRNSPSRALKSVITALQTNGGDTRGSGKNGQRLSDSGSVQPASESGENETVVCRESIHMVREFRKLYGLLRMRSGRKEETMDLSLHEKDGSRHGS